MIENYKRIAEILNFLTFHFKEQPELTEIAAKVNLSPFHLQRVFKRWVGITPKQFLQFVTLEYAKKLLEDSRSILETTFASGLSSPGRLHDLFISLEAVSPGEYKKKGEGIQIYYGLHESPFGYAFIAITERGICGLSLHDARDVTPGLIALSGKWARAGLLERPDLTKEYAEVIFRNDVNSKIKAIKLIVVGTNFQVKVWEALLKIPEGQICSYQDLARYIGHHQAVRAVGNALGKNPISYLIPCHRVIKNMGFFGNYQWGEVRKRAILGWEAAQCFQKTGGRTTINHK